MAGILSLKPYEKCDKRLSSYKLKSIHAIFGFIRANNCFTKQRNGMTFQTDIIHPIFEFYHIDNDFIKRLLDEEYITTLDDPLELFAAKIRLCSNPLIISTESESNDKYTQAIDKKTKYLADIVYEIENSTFNLTSSLEMHQLLFNMISNNIFRPLPRWNADGEKSVHDNDDWIHLELVYTILRRMLISVNIVFDRDLMKQVMDEQHMIQKMIQLFSTPNDPERDYLKTIIHRIYGIFMDMRAEIRHKFQDYLCSVIYDEQTTDYYYGKMYSDYYQKMIYKYHGVGEILEIYGSICSGFAVPLNEQHKTFIVKVIIPLHTCRKYIDFSPQLMYICRTLVNKDHGIVRKILYGMLRYWPKIDSIKEEAIIEEISYIVKDLIVHPQFQWDDNRDILRLVIDKFVECIKTLHHGINTKLLIVFADQQFMQLLGLDQSGLIQQKIMDCLEDLKDNKKCKEEAQDIIKNITESTLC